MILLIDNYDSFSYNLFQFVGTINPDIKVIRNDEMTVSEIENILRERFRFLVSALVIRQYVRHLGQRLHTHRNLCMANSQRLSLMIPVKFLRE